MKFSPSEQKALNLLKTAPQNTTALIKLYFQPDQPPFNSRQIVVGVLSSLMKKAQASKAPFRIRKSKRAGPQPIKFWIEK